MAKSIHKRAADLFHLLGHPGRLRILDELRRAKACVCHLQTVLRRPQAYVSQQLRVLREADLVAGEKDGLNVYYAIAHPSILSLLEHALGPSGEPTRLPECPCPYCKDESERPPEPARLGSTDP
jgi:ArsR family transcriptional regulator